MNQLDEFLSVDDTEYVVVTIAGKSIALASVSAGDLYDYFEEVAQASGKPERRLLGIKLVSKSLVDGTPATGTPSPVRIGTEATVEALKKKNPKHVGQLVEAVLELNGMRTDDAVKAAKVLAKNGSGEAPQGASPTDSQ